jgi:hypothetical protein
MDSSVASIHIMITKRSEKTAKKRLNQLPLVQNGKKYDRRELIPMRTMNPVIEEINLVGTIADMKQLQYQNMLLLHALVELLDEKGMISKKELTNKARLLDEVSARLNRPIT